MTEEEQIQKIQDLKKAIEQKKRLIEECEKCYASWGLNSDLPNEDEPNNS